MDDLSAKPELYHPDILSYARNPVRWRKEHDAQYIIKAYNPVCGDKFEIRLDVDLVITDTSFFGYGCVVSKASTALLAEILVGLQIQDARLTMQAYVNKLHEKEIIADTDSRFEPFLIARNFPGRIQCVLLGWEALLKDALFTER